METEISTLKAKHESLSKEVDGLSSKCSRAETQISEVRSASMKLNGRLDSLQKRCDALDADHKADKSELMGSIGKTNEQVQAAGDAISSRTVLGICSLCLLLAAIIAIAYVFAKKFRVGYTSISEVRKAQEALQSAQAKMQEESLKLDNQLLDVVQKQLDASVSSERNKAGEPDHSLVVKLANEIARIETNLSKMDKSVRGYKQLVQAKDRMINNVRANGYEIISLLGQEYNDGMQFPTRFVPDDSLPEGKRIITGMIKMQVNYNGKMIQPAEIVVRQNI